MSSLSWNEIKQRAVAFSKEWENETREDAAAQTFLDGFFEVFGVLRRRVATFETKVKRIGGRDGYIDLLWKGTILIEMKSAGGDLAKAHKQATEYFPGLKDTDVPQYILVCDFKRFRLYDLDAATSTPIEFELKDLVSNVQHFAFIAGYIKREFKEEDPVNIKAAEQMGQLHDMLKEVGYSGHQLEIYLVRLLFCLFSDDTSIFDKGIFQEFVSNTSEDGRGLGSRLSELFETLNTSPSDRLSNLDDDLVQFPYVNGKLFAEQIRIPQFGRKMRELLLKVSTLNWGSISPNIFGSMFQYVMNPEERRALGAHYTSEKNILKVIKPLFLDELRAEFQQIKNSRPKLKAFHDKLSKLTFLDPACGCGNFLIIAYRELRLLEIEVVKQLLGNQLVNVNQYFKVDVDQFYGIEIEEFPAQIAQVAMWLTDHQMNMRASEEFGEYYLRLPLRKSANIVHANALALDWKSLIASADFIFGNPPFVGSKIMTDVQRKEVVDAFANAQGSGVLDYVCAWYVNAARYIQHSSSRVAFVSTNSITQGEQVGALWSVLLSSYKVRIHFAHQTFKWSNDAKGVAAVYCVIIGFGATDPSAKTIYEYETVRSAPFERAASNINPYLVDAPDTVVRSSQTPICPNVPAIGIGNKPIDGGHYLFTTAEKDAFISSEPDSAKYFRRWIGADEFLNGYERWCLWLGDVAPSTLRSMPHVMARIDKVRQTRLASKSAPTRKLADTPTRFHVENIPSASYLVIPKVSSERRHYIPIGYEEPSTLSSDLLFIVGDVTYYHFGVLSSLMHMSWVRYTCGRLKSDYRYSKDIVYNNFPWPENVSDKSKSQVELCAKQVLTVRSHYPESTLADMYDPLSMPHALLKAHQELDRAVDRLYSSKPFTSESTRIAFLFELYEKYTQGLFAQIKKKQNIKRS